jgi:hypothetical protein
LRCFEGEVLTANGIWQELQMMDECNHILIFVCVPILAGKHAYHFLLLVLLMQVRFGLVLHSTLLLELITL